MPLEDEVKEPTYLISDDLEAIMAIPLPYYTPYGEVYKKRTDFIINWRYEVVECPCGSSLFDQIQTIKDRAKKLRYEGNWIAATLNVSLLRCNTCSRRINVVRIDAPSILTRTVLHIALTIPQFKI